MRDLERRIARLARKLARARAERRVGVRVAAGAETEVHDLVQADQLKAILGVPPFDPDANTLEDKVGVATGLAYTSTGGDVLEIEVSVVPGSREAAAHRHARRRDEGIGERGAELRARARERARPGARVPAVARPARAHPRRCDAEGRAERGHRHRVRDRERAERHPAARRRRDDGRDHAARSRAADRWAEGEGRGGAAEPDRARRSYRARMRASWTSCRPR